MPSPISAAVKAQIKLARPLLKRLTIKGERSAQDALGFLGSKALVGRVSYRDEPFENFEAEWAVPAERGEGVTLYLHGGSYTAGSLAYAKGFGGIVAQETGRETLCVGYRLAPENPFPAGLEDAFEAYERMLKIYRPGEIAVVGESAGGGLIFCLMQLIKERGLELPSCIVALSPWADLNCCYPSFKTNAENDPSLFENALKYSARQYCRGDYKNPLVSPVYGDLTGLPPTLIFAGSHELLMDDTVVLANKLSVSGVECTCHIVEGMWHVYVIYGLPESREALGEIKSFLERFNNL